MSLVQTEPKKIYIRVDEQGWQPGANTLAWYPLEIDTKDYSGNNRDGTNSNVTFSGGIATFNGSSSMVTIAHANRQKPTANFTISGWARATSWTATEGGLYAIIYKGQLYAQDYPNYYYGIQIEGTNKYAAGGIGTGTNYSTYPGNSTTVVGLNAWHLYTLTNNGTIKTLYLDGQQIAQATSSTVSSNFSVPLTIGNAYRYNHDAYFNGNISNVILENKTRSLQEISDYYNLTKGNYGL